MKEHQKLILEAHKSHDQVKNEVQKSHWRLNYHVSPPAYWMNDPNGFCVYNGEYHLFYQHHPFSPEWGPMYWGHVKSKDLAFWEEQPIALAPSEEYDRDGCFSGSAIEKDGKLYLMYTGNVWTGDNHDTDLKQVQCLAVSTDGLTFEKLKDNPVIEKAPDGDIHPYHFRDPKVWKHGDFYYCVLGSRTNDHQGQVLLYRSSDLINWEYINVLAKGEVGFSFMWECPDLFHLDGQDVLVMSPQGVKPKGYLYHNLHQAGYLLGKLDYEKGTLEHGDFHLLDYGFDFYAPQTTLDDQGRRILIAWMAMWESEMPEQKNQWAGAMTIPRELKIEGETIIQRPVLELQKLRKDEVHYENVELNGELELEGIQGDSFELEMVIDAKKASQFGLKLRVNEELQEETVLTYNRDEGFFIFNRDHSGKGPKGERKAPVVLKDNQLRLQIFVDKSSVEVFINEGEKVMTGRIYPSEKSTGVLLFANGPVEIVQLKKWGLKNCIN